jgi:predicted outer membrane repeat protein
MYKYQLIQISLGLLLVFDISQAATIQVNAELAEQLDDGLCSIAEAIIAANTDQAVDGCAAGNGADTILLGDRNYSISKVDNVTDGPNGLPVIRSDVTIQGTRSNEDFFENPRTVTIIGRAARSALDPPLPYNDGNPPMRFFYVMEGAKLLLKNLMLNGGFIGSRETFFGLPEIQNSLLNKGGAILNLGSLDLQHVSLLSNTAVGSGGAIYSAGNLVIRDTSIKFNQAVLLGGGAIDAKGSLTIQRTFLSQNGVGNFLSKNSAESGGAIRFLSSSSLGRNEFVSVNTILVSNRATLGGAIYLDAGVASRFLHTTITNNTAKESGGGLFIEAGNDSDQPQIDIGNTIIANNTGSDCQFLTPVTITAAGNWFGDDTCNKRADGNPAIVNPSSLSLSTPDVLIPAHSPVIDAGDDKICSAPLVGNQDMLGNPRMLDGDGLNGTQCEIGAVERQHSSALTAFVENTTFSFNDFKVLRRNEFGGFNLLETIDANHQWTHFRFDHQDFDQYASLMFLSPPSFQGFQAGVMRLNSVEGCCTVLNAMFTSSPPNRTEFDVRFQEFTYLDQFHLNEQVSVLGARVGIQRSENGEVIVLSDFELSGTGQWTTVRTPKMGGTPHVFLTAQTANGGQPVSVRVRNVTESSFEVALFEEEALMQSGHVAERIAYLLIYSPEKQGQLQLSDRQVSYQLKQIELDHQWQPVFDVELKLQEDQSRDNELFHLKERVDVIKIGEHVFAQQVSSRGGDPAVLRIR